MPPRNFKSLSLSSAAYDGVLKAREEVVRRGLSSVPKEILASVKETDPFTTGTLIELATAALLYVTDEKRRKR